MHLQQQPDYLNLPAQVSISVREAVFTVYKAKSKRSTMPTKIVGDERLSKFKNKGKDLSVSWCFSFQNWSIIYFMKLHILHRQKLRERRIAECVELRKAHKNENFLKRRNITLSSLPDEDALSSDCLSNETVSLQKPLMTELKPFLILSPNLFWLSSVVYV